MAIEHASRGPNSGLRIDPDQTSLCGEYASRRKLAQFFNVSLTTIRRWEKEHGFPAAEFRIPPTPTGEPYWSIPKAREWIAALRSALKKAG